MSLHGPPIESKSLRLVGLILLVHVLLVSTHEGEFWPFSIFPMFSQAGAPWTKVLVRDVTDLDESTLQARLPLPVSMLPGQAVPLMRYGINQDDLSNFIAQTPVLNSESISLLKDLLGAQNLKDKRWLIFQVRGRLEQDSVIVESFPLMLFQPDTVILTDHLIHTR